MGTGRPNLRFHPIPAAKRALYQRLFRKWTTRYRNSALRPDVFVGSRWKFENLFCRLMHRQHLAHELNAHHRQHCLVLDKRVGTPVGPPGTIPSYFRQRILKQRFVEKPEADVEQEQEQRVIVVDDDSASDVSDEGVLLDEEDRVVEKKHPEIPDPTKFSVLKEEIKEYCAIQEKIQIIISMLKSRAKELEHDGKDEDVSEVEVSFPSIKEEHPDFDASELESLAEKYYDNSDDETAKDDAVAKQEHDACDEVEVVESKPEIVFVDTEALDSDSDVPDIKPKVEELIPFKSLKDISKSDLFDPTFSTIKLEPVDKQSVVDSLLNKFNLKAPVTPPKAQKPTEEEAKVINRLRDRSRITSKPRYVEEDEPKKVRPSKIFDKIHKKFNLELENSNSNSSSEFYGFDEGEVVKLDKPSVPGLLPTPIVKKCRPNAPFLSHENSFEDVKIENRDDLFREEGLISFGSLPPRLECPRRPDDMVRPRTVAQKRILLQKKNDVRYLMIDNEAKIFHELEKRSKNIDAELDFSRMKELQDQNIPFTRDTWRALTWLRTEKGRYFFQTMKIDNHSVKLSGCKGNHPSKKFGKKQLSGPATISRKQSCHCPELPANVNIDLSAINEPGIKVEVKEEVEDVPMILLETDKKLLCTSKIRPVSARPGPLSSKLRYDNELLLRTEDDAYLGPLEILELPSVEIEVFPRIDRPLDPTVKPYLKMILPFRGITEKWARFSVSTLKTPDRNDSDIPLEDRSFCFTLPYMNNQRRILVRRRVVESNEKKPPAESLDKFEKQLTEQLVFRKHLDEPEDAEKVDSVEKDCADILSEMTNTVAISLAEEVFVAKDPDCDYTREDKPVYKATINADAGKSNESVAKSKRMLREMKRLNATIIETIPEQLASPSEEQKSRCDERYCSKGCICDVFSGKHTSSNVVRSHCNKNECIFGCECGYDKRNAGKDIQADLSEEGISALTSEDVKYLREKATARLAKEERDFTPTVILTTNSTVLVRNTDTDARRNKKKPKKYDDYYNENSVKSLLNGVTPGEADIREPLADRGKPCSSVSQPLTLVEKIRHSHVVLNKLQDMENIEPWCLIHCLYRCYCRGNATSGKPFKFNEESNIVLPTPVVHPEPDPLLSVYEPRRRLYSFEKTEEVNEIRQPFRKRDSSEESYKPWNERRKKKRKTLEDQHLKSPEKKECYESTASSTRASIEDLQIHDGQTCRRAIPVNRNFFKTRNFYRKERYQRDITEMERNNPAAEKRLKLLLDRCEKSFFEERKRELEALALKANAKIIRQRQLLPEPGAKQEKERVIEPVHIDIVGDDESIQQNALLAPLIDLNKMLIYTGKKKYYVESDAIEKGRINLMNLAKKFRKPVYVLRKVTGDLAAKTVLLRYKTETIKLRARKYYKNQPYMQGDNEHVDLDAYSDSDDQGSISPLIQDSGVENDTQRVMLDQVNSDIVHTMQHIRDMLRKNTTMLNPPKKGILYLFRWEKFLQAFNEDLLDVWDITFQNGTELVIITTEKNRKNTPSFKNTKSARLARRCTFETKGASLLTQMTLHQIDNPETNKLALVLFGTVNYWRFCGFIKAENDYLAKGCEVRPTPITHPKLAPKISMYFEAFVAARAKRAEAVAQASTAAVAAKVAARASKPTATTSVPVPVPKPIKEEIPCEPVQHKVILLPAKMSSFKSNVKLMETKIKDFKNIAIPNVGTRRWFMLNVVNDFSDIYIPSWKSCLTYGRIMQAIQLANRYKKTVKLTSIVLKNSQEDVLPQIYAAPGQGDCIFLGPYTYTQNIDLMLCQNVDGKMFTREEYERNNHIVRTEQTTGSWLYMKPNVAAPSTAPAPSTVSTFPVPSPAPHQGFVKLTPPSHPATETSASEDDCVVIDDDDDAEKPSTSKQDESPETSKNNSQLESLIHQLYNDSDSDDGATHKPSTSKPDTTEKSATEQAEESAKRLSLLVQKAIVENNQQLVQSAENNSAISNRRLSYIPPPSVSSVISVDETQPMMNTLSDSQDTNKLKRHSTGTVDVESTVTEAKKSRLSLPATAVPSDEIVCLDDDDDDDEEANKSATSSASIPKAKAPSSTTILNSQQAALIASKINLLDPNQKGVAYNPSTGVLRIKRSLMNSLTEGSSVTIPTASSSKSQSNSALATKAQPQKLPPATAAVRSIPSSIMTPPVTPRQVSPNQAPPEVVVVPPKSCILPPRVPTKGVLRSNIPGLGLVPVLWSTKDIILKVRELSVKQQFVRLANFEAAIVLLNRFIRKNTYTFKPFSLTIGWKFEAMSAPLPAEENLINTISLRCVVTADGVIDLYKASAIIAFQNTKPNFYEELLLLRLSILCCKKDQYEEEKCHRYFEKIFVKATSTIKELQSASEALTTQSTFLREQQEERRSYLDNLKTSLGIQPRPTMHMVSKRVSVPQSILDRVSKAQATTAAAASTPAPGQQKETVIVIDDD